MPENENVVNELQALEARLHVKQGHPDYDYTSLDILASSERDTLFTDVQFTLVEGWEVNHEKDEADALEIYRQTSSDGFVVTRKYFRRRRN